MDTINLNSPSTSTYNPWASPYKVSTNIYDDRVEVILKCYSNITYTNDMLSPPRIWKEIYRPIDGKIKLVETVEGTYHPACEEYYTF